MAKRFCVYMMASKLGGTLYSGVTSDLRRRVHQHKKKQAEGFTAKYNVGRLVHYEVYENAESAILREKQLKHWNRQWKINLIEEKNPNWVDLYPSLFR